jgi:hypothetical protein
MRPVTSHDHPPEGECPPSCPAWAEGVLSLAALLHRPQAMLAACRAAERIEHVIVAPATPGAELPPSLQGQELVRLNLVVGRDCPEVLLDEWGLRVTLTFRGRRHDCAIPWAAVKAGALAPPARKKVRRFGVVAGGVEAAAGEGSAAHGVRAGEDPAAPAEAATPAPAGPAALARTRPAFGVIRGGRSGDQG